MQHPCEFGVAFSLSFDPLLHSNFEVLYLFFLFDIILEKDIIKEFYGF